MGCFVDPDVELRPVPILVPASPFCKPSTEVAGTSRDMDCHHGGGWACLDLKTGQKKWNERAVGKGSLCYADGMLYLLSESRGRGGLATCSPEGLQLTGRVEVEGSGPSWAHPVVVGGRLYLRYDTNLYCFDVKRPG